MNRQSANRSGPSSAAASGASAPRPAPGRPLALAVVVAAVAVVVMPPPSAAADGSSLIVVAPPPQRTLPGLDGRPVDGDRPARAVPPPRHVASVPPVAAPAPSAGSAVHAAAAAVIPNCAVAWRLGHGRARVGEAGYAPHLDRDGDGVACEVEPGAGRSWSSGRRWPLRFGRR